MKKANSEPERLRYRKLLDLDLPSARGRPVPIPPALLEARQTFPWVMVLISLISQLEQRDQPLDPKEARANVVKDLAWNERTVNKWIEQLKGAGFLWEGEHLWINWNHPLLGEELAEEGGGGQGDEGGAHSSGDRASDR